jgi:hypothetical protein
MSSTISRDGKFFISIAKQFILWKTSEEFFSKTSKTIVVPETVPAVDSTEIEKLRSENESLKSQYNQLKNEHQDSQRNYARKLESLSAG